MSTYCTRTWLNASDSPSTGSIVCYDGKKQYDDGEYHHTFLEISDCHVKARLHKTDFDTKKDFILKLKMILMDINLFINHLESDETTL